jgi:ParB family chromosome partitioning protein
LRSGALSAGHARCLIGRADAAALAERIVDEGLTVRQVEALVQDRPAAPTRERKSRAKNADTRAAESELKETLGLDVDIRSSGGEKGELRIRYKTLEQFEYVRMKLMR